MCRWLAYGGAPVYLETLLIEPENSLIEQSLRAREATTTTNGDGFGVGWYGARADLGLYREVLPAWNDSNLRNIAHQIRAPLFFAHVRASTGTEVICTNCHPFVHDRWMFMHNGQIGGYRQLRRELERMIPDEFYDQRRGTTDSEVIFYLLFGNQLTDDPAGALARTVSIIVQMMARAGIAEPFRLTAALSDGERMFAVRFSTDEVPPSLYWSRFDAGVLIASEPLQLEPAEWHPIAAGQLLIADRNGGVALRSLVI